MATVVSDVPDASSAAPRPSRLGAPPVPMMSRDSSRTPSMTSASSRSSAPAGVAVVVSVMVSASLYCGDKLDGVTLGERGSEPLAAGHHLGVVGDGDAEPAPVGCLPAGGKGASGHRTDEHGQGSPVSHRVLGSVQDDVHAVSLSLELAADVWRPEKRPGLKGSQRLSVTLSIRSLQDRKST